MSENTRPIVVCCDGTWNTFGQPDTNVRRVYDLLDYDRYSGYYDPGLGTDETEKFRKKLITRLQNVAGATVAYGLTRNVLSAYAFLMDQYKDETSKLFLFGFSRGALTVRRLAKMVAVCGLPPIGGRNLIAHANNAYRRFKDHGEDDPHFISFRKMSRPCNPTFIGVWDTVRAEGVDQRGKKCTMVDGIKCARHAIALDEKRSAFEPEIWENEPTGRIKQRWFPGDHSDIGGGHYEEAFNEEDLSYISLDWMLKEANKLHLGVDGQAVSEHAARVRTAARTNGITVHDMSTNLPWSKMKSSPRRTETGASHEVDHII